MWGFVGEDKYFEDNALLDEPQVENRGQEWCVSELGMGEQAGSWVSNHLKSMKVWNRYSNEKLEY